MSRLKVDLEERSVPHNLPHAKAELTVGADLGLRQLELLRIWESCHDSSCCVLRVLSSRPASSCEAAHPRMSLL